MTYIHRRGARLLLAALVLVLPAGLLHPAAAAPAAPRGTASLAALLTSDGDQFDSTWSDYDIATEAVLAVVGANPDSKVAVLTDGSVALTAFVPTDGAFRRLGRDVLGHRFTSEAKLFAALVKNLGVRTIEKVLLYHVVPGATITSRMALKSNGARLTTALGNGGKKITVLVRSKKRAIVFLGDRDRNDRNPRLIRTQLDLNQGNRQIAHGIDRVLRPADL